MNVIYASDDGYAWLMGISMVSLLENSRDVDDVHIWLFGDGISAENERKLLETATQYHRRLDIIDVNQLSLPESLYSGRYPKSAFSRLFAYKLLPETIDRVLYLDCDIIVDSSVAELYDQPMDDKIIYAVKDCVSKAYKQKIGITGDDVYINTGVMLMNLERMRHFPMEEKISEFVGKYAFAMNYADQEIINGIFQGEFGILPPEWNVMTQFNQYNYSQLGWIRHPHNYYSEKEIEYAKRHARIFHYTTCMLNIRPWYGNSKLNNAHVFNRYKRLSPWKNQEKKEMKFTDSKYKTMKLLSYLPKWLMNFCLGMLHAYIRPYYVMISMKIKGKKKELAEASA